MLTQWEVSLYGWSPLFCLESAALIMLNQQQIYLIGQIQNRKTGVQPYKDTCPYGECSLFQAAVIIWWIMDKRSLDIFTEKIISLFWSSSDKKYLRLGYKRLNFMKSNIVVASNFEGSYLWIINWTWRIWVISTFK